MAIEISNELLTSYHNTHYVVFCDQGNICLQPEAVSHDGTRLLKANGVSVASYITAYNPLSKQRTIAENTDRNSALANQLKRLRFRSLPGEGRDIKGLWPVEPSFLVLGMDEAIGHRWARQFEQYAFLIVEIDQPVKLVITQ